jgi:SAM-dependent methyltransferase
MSKLPSKIQDIQKELTDLSTKKTFEQTQRVILSVIKLLDETVSENDLDLFQLFTDSDGKIRANASWFFEDSVIADRKATYKIHGDNTINMDFKVYGVSKASKRVISWATALTPNFEDEPFNTKFNIGVDFIVPKSTDRVIIVLTNNYVIRTLELKGDLTATYQEILTKWSEIKDFSNKSSVHTALWESFDLSPLNKKFYSGISERFILLRQHLVKEKILDEKHAPMFANRLIGRIIFCWFLDKKGIINPDLKYFDSKSFTSDTEYYKTKLERLFFSALNAPIDDREFKDEVTPFLNGGLFEVRQNDLYQDSKLSFPKNYFDDLFTFLSAYNFTTDESTSQFQQVAIDPEMLGRIFENLLAEITEETGEQARKAKGAFYTPREIVDYMCKESLKEYLKTKLPEDTYRDQRLYQLIDAPDKDFQDQDHNWRRDWKPYKDTLISALDDLKVLDPACGSGAFPIGMLQLLVRVYERLDTRFDSYRTKLQIIEKNIYGVDIEPMAVEIARLRTWLSIIVDEDSDSKKIKPLPNLEFKFVCANSLIDLDQSGIVTLYGDDPDLENKLRDIRDAYFNTESVAKKKKLRNDYDKLVNEGEGLFGQSEKSKQLKTYRPFDNESSASFFSPNFMFGIKGFDVIIANPPYITIGGKQDMNINSTMKELLAEKYISYSYKANYFVLFTEFGINLATEKGVVTYIVPRAILDNTHMDKIRESILENTKIFLLLELKYKLFENAETGGNLIFIAQKESDSKIRDANVVNTAILKESMNLETLQKVPVSQSKYCYSNGKVFSLNTEENNSLLEKIEDKSVLLGDICLIKNGVNTGNAAKILLSKENKGKTYKKILEGKDINKYTLNWSGMWINYDKDLKKQLDPSMLETRQSYVDFSLRDESIFNSEKLIIRQTADRPIATIDNEGFITRHSTHLILSNSKDYSLKYVLGLINSSLMKYYYRALVPEEGKAFAEVKAVNLKKLPIKKLSLIEQQPFIHLVDQILSMKNSDPSSVNIKELEDQIDNMVYELYGMSQEDINLITNKLK